MGKFIYVLHERSTKEHFTALETYSFDKNLEVKYREFLIFRYFVKSIIRLDIALFIQQIRNILFFISMLFSSKKNIIIGIAPFDFYLPFITFFLKKHNLFYFTSWGDWSGKFHPKKKFSQSRLIKNSWNDFLTRHIKAVFSVTDAAAKSIQENFILDCPTVVVAHSIDNSISVNKSYINKRDPNKVNLIYVGRLVESKGVEDLLTLIKKLDRKIYSLKIIGDGPLRKLVEKASIEYENIQYMGYINSKREMYNLFSQCDVQLLFSKKTKDNNWEELFGMVIIEAMYCGVPTISTSHIGPKSIITHEVNGFLIDENNILEETTKILEEQLFKEKWLITKTQEDAKQFFKHSLAKKWSNVLDNYI